jgi:selenium-binding protein 1
LRRALQWHSQRSRSFQRCETFDVFGRWEIDRGPQNLHCDLWWNLPRDYMVTSKWALPPQFENGIVPEDLLSNKYGHRI